MRIASLLLALAIAFTSACVREKERPKTDAPPPSPARAVKPAPLAEHDLAGRKRASPRATMGALEADPAQSPPQRPPKKSSEPQRERAK